MGSIIAISTIYLCKEFCGNGSNANEKNITINLKKDHLHKSRKKKESLLSKKL